MQLEEAKIKFIQSWGTFGSKWGINRTMAQVHALLLISPDSLSSDSIMEALQISRGNANMNLRALIDWGLIIKQLKPGDRKEYFFAEKDMWKIARQIMEQRKRRELEPIIEVLTELIEQTEGEGEEVEAFKNAIAELNQLSIQADQIFEKMINADKNWMLNSFIKKIIDVS